MGFGTVGFGGVRAVLVCLFTRRRTIHYYYMPTYSSFYVLLYTCLGICELLMGFCNEERMLCAFGACRS